MEEDSPVRTQNGLVRGSPAAEALTKDEPLTKALPDGYLNDEMPSRTRSGLVRRSPTVKVQKKYGRVVEGLPDGWRKEYRPRKTGSFKDTVYIDPVSGYEFRSMKDVHRYLETGDIYQCAMRPKKSSTICDNHITGSQTLTSTSSQHTKPGTVDKGIQCEILTSEGILVPWEELVTQSGNVTEHTVLPESESLEAVQRYGDKLETLENTSVQPVSARCSPRQTKSLKRKEQDVGVKSKKTKTSPVVTPVRVSPRLAALHVQREASIEPEDQPINVNPLSCVQTIEDNSNDQSQMRQSGNMNQIHGNLESTFNQLHLSQAGTANGTESNQENLSQADTANVMEAIQEDRVDTVNHMHTNQEKTANQVELIIADIPVLDNRSITDHVKSTCNQVRLNQVDTVTQTQIFQENMIRQPQLTQHDTVGQIHIDLASAVDYSGPRKADTVNQLQANQENAADHLHFSQVDCIAQIEIVQGDMPKHLQLSQADTVDMININLEHTTNHLEPNYAENPMLQAGFSWPPEQNGGASITDFWKNVENQDSSVPMPVDGATVSSFPENVRFQNAAGAEEPALPMQSAVPETDSDQSGLAFQSLFGNAWVDPCIEFAFKTLTGDIPVLDDTSAVTNYFPEQQDLNKDPAPNCSASVLDNTRNHTQVDVNLPAPMPSDKLYNGSWFPPQ
ncbi:hypothetical protein HU200_056192 [Digitaria exilis]|uniref:MBD domain-containing protein n=1 Tax=Digitaria exilis TaxID=1010633 RepID=A0A835E171_9POAL|nr:hypothetical protein HU200_056192 [Digitaria exilis]